MKDPKPKTLARYGLTLEEWQAMLLRQGGTCAVCRKAPTTGRLCVDHEHVAGWKKMEPSERKLYCRGLTCWTCNHYYLGRGITIAKAANVVQMLSDYEARRPPRAMKGAQ